MTTISGRVVRKPLGPTSFDDLLPEGVRLVRITPTGLEFSADLDATTTAAIYARMTSTDDVDQAKRAVLMADRDMLADGDPLRRLYDYMLGD